MALSSREILLVLRARDEATRTIGRVSSAMKHMDRSATATSTKMISDQRNNLRALSAQLGDVNNRYSHTIADAWTMHRQQQNATNDSLAALRANVRQVNDEYTRLTRTQQDLRDSNRIDAAQYKRNMQNLSRLRQDQVRDLASERTALQDLARANHAAYNQQVSDARQIHIQQQEEIRQARMRAQAIIDEHTKIIRVHGEERELLRQRGQMLMANGAGAMAAGTAMTYFGARGLAAYTSNIGAAMDYETQVRRTMTQIDTFRAKLDQISDLGKEVANEIAVPFEEIQPALYDIFSSIDVGFKGARTLIKQFAHDAVAGTTELSTATRANLLIMNAYKLEAKDAADVSDFMFQLVRKGVGTYDEFAKTIGRSIPSARRAGQSYQTLGAMIAFLTRNGLSAAMASTSAARALDAISHPETVKKLGKLGVQVKNMKGEFLPLPKILDQMNDKFGKLTAPERSKALYELFKASGGTIQARRFFDNYFKNADEFNKRSREMANAAGAAGDAFKTMADSPQAKLQQLKNDWMILRIELGENLLPLAMKIIETVNGWIDGFNNLSPEIKHAVAIIGGLVLAGTTLAGILTIVGGAIAVVGGAAATLGIGLGAFVGIVSGVVLAVGILAGAGYALYKKWDQVKALFAPVADKFNEAKNRIADAFDDFVARVKDAWAEFKASVDWDKIKRDMEEARPDIEAALTGISIAISTGLKAIGIAAQSWAAYMGPVVTGMIRGLIQAFRGAVEAIHGIVQLARGTVEIFKGIFTGDLGRVWNGVKQQVSGLKNAVVGTFKMMQGAIMTIVGGFVNGVINLFRKLFNILVGHSIVPDLVNGIIRNFARLPGAVAAQVGAMVSAVLGRIAALPGRFIATIARLVSGASAAFARLPGMFGQTVAAVGTKIGQLMGILRSLPGQISAVFSGFGSLLYNAGSSLIGGLISGISSRLGTLRSMASEAAGIIGRFFPGSPIKEGPLKSWNNGGAGRRLMDTLVQGIRERKPHIKNAANEAANEVEKGVSHVVERMATKLLEGMKDTDPEWMTLMDQARDLIDNRLDDMRNHLEHKLKDVKKKVRQKALDAFDKGRGGREASLLKNVKDATEKDFNRLRTIVDRYQAKVKELDSAREELQRRKDIKTSYIEGLSRSIAAFGDMSNIRGQEIMETDSETGEVRGTGNYKPVTVSDILKGKAEKLRHIREWGNAIGQMRVLGFSADVINEVLQMGPEAGWEYAQALVNATPSEIGQINADTAGITQTASDLATAAGGHMYDVGIAIQQGIVDGLAAKAEELRLKAVEMAQKIEQALRETISGHQIGKDIAAGIKDGMDDKHDAVKNGAKRLAHAIVESFNSELKIGSPSKIALGIASNFGGSIGQGLLNEKRTVEAASHELAKQMVFDPNATHVSTQPAGSYATQSAPSAPNIHQEITIHTQEIDPRAHAAALGWELASRGL